VIIFLGFKAKNAGNAAHRRVLLTLKREKTCLSADREAEIAIQ